MAENKSNDVKVVIFGATGVIGRGVLIECLESPAVGSVLVVARRTTGVTNSKLREIVRSDFDDLTDIADELGECDACYYCLGVSSAGMSESDYSRITVDYTLAAARALTKQSHKATFCFISGMGTDDTMKSRTMWARVKGRAEHKLKQFPLAQLYLLRPGVVIPVKGIKHDKMSYRILIALTPLLKLMFPRMLITTEQIGKAMIELALHGSDKQTLENVDIKSAVKQLR